MATMRITANGDYYLPVELLPITRGFELGAKLVGTGPAVVQLFGEIAGVKTNLDSAQTVTQAAPKAWPNKYSANPRRGVTVTGLVTNDVLTLEVL